MESEQKHKGEKFIYLLGNDGRYFKTSCGEIEWEDDVLTIKTKRSVYRFRKIKIHSYPPVLLFIYGVHILIIPFFKLI